MGCLTKAFDIYRELCGREFEDTYHNRAAEASGRTWEPYCRGGINKEELEDTHTLTLFYLAQAYTKMGLKEKAAQHCGNTLQRQFATQKYEVR